MLCEPQLSLTRICVRAVYMPPGSFEEEDTFTSGEQADGEVVRRPWFGSAWKSDRG